MFDKEVKESFEIELIGQPPSLRALIDRGKESPPSFIIFLVKQRDKIAKRFNLKTIDSEQGQSESLGPIAIKHISDTQAHLSFDDWHLIYFGDLQLSGKHLTIKNRIVFKHWFGRVYFYSIFPAHFIIYKSLMSYCRKLSKSFEQD